MAAVSWPPNYSILTAMLGSILNLEQAGKVVSLLSATGILILLPYLIRELGMNAFWGLFAQIFMVLSPAFLKASLWMDNHFLNAFLFISTLYFGIRYFDREEKGLPWILLLFLVLAALTKYSSWVLFASIVIVNLGQSDLRSVRIKQTVKLMVLFLVSMSPWFIYNVLVNGTLIKGTKIALLIGQGLSENGLMKMNHIEWWAYGVYDYKGAFDLISRYPQRYLRHVGLNMKTIGSYYIYNYQFLSYFAVFSAIGSLNSVINWKVAKNKFLIFVTLFYTILLIFTRVVWEYYIHLILFWGSIGISVTLSIAWDQTRRFTRNRHLSRMIVGIPIVIVLLAKGTANRAEFEHLIENRFTRDGILIRELKNDLTKLYSIHGNPTQDVSIMSMFSFFPDIYRAGFHTVQSPNPSSPVRFFCYDSLTKRQEFYFSMTNFPPAMELVDYVPPDYFLLTPTIHRAFLREENLNINDFRAYLEKVGWWDVPGTSLYKVKSDKLSCSKRR